MLSSIMDQDKRVKPIVGTGNTMQNIIFRLGVVLYGCDMIHLWLRHCPQTNLQAEQFGILCSLIRSYLVRQQCHWPWPCFANDVLPVGYTSDRLKPPMAHLTLEGTDRNARDSHSLAYQCGCTRRKAIASLGAKVG